MVEYRPQPVAADLLRESTPVVLPPNATWGDVWNAYLEERSNNERLNCQLEAIAAKISAPCRALLGLPAAPATGADPQKD
ncbi:MAG TPA: hypothetical protein VFL15_01240 [Gammaproteobacteria bacterium]|nr:hypothetical protein [Gammaproteobacteria bacterium]